MKTALSVCVGLALVVFARPAHAQSQQGLAARAQRSERVVVGRVAAVDAAFETNEFGDQLIVSKLRLRVDETLKGPSQPTVEVIVEGGSIGDLTLEVSDMPSVKPGERAAFFLTRAGNGEFVPRDRGLGIMKLDPSERVEGGGPTLDEIRDAVRGAQR